MDIVKFQGRLGNQMFQYAFMEELRSRGREVYADLSYYDTCRNLFILEKVFPNVKVEDRHSFVCSNQHQEAIGWIFDERVFDLVNCLYDGYWQSEKCFQTVKDKIRKDFTFDIKDGKLKEFENQVNSRIGVHIRRTDYIGTDFEVCGLAYYKNAIEKIRELSNCDKFVFFSDDIEYVRENFSDIDYILCQKGLFENYKDSYDMYMMTKCTSLIISNSSFSWWGAWLNNNRDKVIIAPQRWNVNFAGKDVWCDGWLKLEN